MNGRSADRRPIRVLHCPNLVGGNAQTLAQAERKLGLASWVVSVETPWAGYHADEFLHAPNASAVTKARKRAELFWRALRDFDIVHFNFGNTILPRWFPGATPVGVVGTLGASMRRLTDMLDVRILSAAGKKIVVTFQGDDARQGDVSLRTFPICIAREVEPGYYDLASDERKRWRIRLFDRHAGRIFALNPDLLHVLPPSAEFLPYTHIDLDDWRPIPVSNDRNRRLTVLHAPSHRRVKGTRFILDAVERLRTHDGIDFDFILVEKMTQHEARRLYERADLLVDQLLAGWYGGLAVELMALGKPVIAYLRPEDFRFVPDAMRDEMPVISATPDSIYRILKEWLTTRRHELPALGARARAYVERWHDPRTVARRMQGVYQELMRPRTPRPLSA
jgi:glycosyltransferase involved in cell wall biosynthesis